MSRSIHTTYKNLKGLTKEEIEEQYKNLNSELAELAKKSSIKKEILTKRKLEKAKNK